KDYTVSFSKSQHVIPKCPQDIISKYPNISFPNLPNMSFPNALIGNLVFTDKHHNFTKTIKLDSEE
ncbi:MAG: hypothetical protein QGG63_02570, partial [Candidatus Pacebacteria bacterium]|nr:hypothetical protein [Candidatus Paceibacterota bacterium]